jgi:thiaminase (transcriptional activator TenA)
MLHEIIWQQNARLAEVCLHHPFVRGLADGTLDPYVAQDGFFLNAFARAYALAAAGSQDGETLISLCELLNGVLRELQLHAGYAKELKI